MWIRLTTQTRSSGTQKRFIATLAHLRTSASFRKLTRSTVAFFTSAQWLRSIVMITDSLKPTEKFIRAKNRYAASNRSLLSSVITIRAKQRCKAHAYDSANRTHTWRPYNFGDADLSPLAICARIILRRISCRLPLLVSTARIRPHQCSIAISADRRGGVGHLVCICRPKKLQRS